MKYFSDSILCRLRYADKKNAVYEGEVRCERNMLAVMEGRDSRISGYGKMIYADGKIVMGYWEHGKPISGYITIQKNGKRDFVSSNKDYKSYNQVFFTEDYQFIPGGHKKEYTNQWSKTIVKNIKKIEKIIAMQQEYLKDKPIHMTKTGDTEFVKYKQANEAIDTGKCIVEMKTESSTEKTAAPKATSKKQSGKKYEKTQVKIIPSRSPIAEALEKVRTIVGKSGFSEGGRVCALLADIAPKQEKERRRIKMAYAANAVTVLMDEKDRDFVIKEATKRLVDYSDMADTVAEETILLLYEIIERKA